MCVEIPPIQPPQTWEGGDETYDLGEKLHINRTAQQGSPQNYSEGGSSLMSINWKMVMRGWSALLNEPRWHLNLETLSPPSL